MRPVLLALALAACQAEDAHTLAAQTARLTLPAGGRVVEPPGPAPHGERVETSACYPSRDPAALARELQDRLRTDWGELRLIPNPAIPGRWVLVGDREGFGISGVVEPSQRGECPGAGEVFVTIGAHVLGATRGGTTAGPEGPRRHGRTRLPLVPRTE